MERTILIDTNLYLDDANVINKLSTSDTKILIPIMILKELDKHKFNKNLSYSARTAIRAILEFSAEHPDRVIFDIEKYENLKEPDEKILASAKKFGAVVATKDISMSITATSMGLQSMLHDVVMNNIFNPYVYIHMSTLQEVMKEDVFGYDSEYGDEDYEQMLKVFSESSKRILLSEHWWFVIIDIEKDHPVVYANNPLKCILERIDNKPRYREFITDGSTIKAKDHFQVCAMYAIEEAPHVLICGPYGSGKSLITSAYALSSSAGNKKTFISRPNLTVDKRFELGFLPGNLEEKLSPWMAGFLSSLYYIFSNTKGQTSDKMSKISYDFVKDHIFKKYFEMIPLDTLQGMSFMDGDLVLLDETQLCSISILSIILSRFGKGSKLVMTGDINQTYGVIPPSESGLLKLLRLLPNKNLAYVTLKNNYRSELIELADKLQDKSLW